MATRGLGTLTLDLVAKIGGFEQGMARASRTTDKRMREIEKRASAMGKTLGSALAAGAGVAAAGLGLYIKNTIEAEKVQAQLTARIKDTAGAAGRTIEQINSEASKLQDLTVFDDETIGGVQAMLLTFKQIQGTNFDEATAAVLDLSTAMGTEANAAALQLGKALNDPIKGVAALGKAGIQFSDDQKKMIKTLVETGNVAGAQRIILDELAGQMGTAAEAARDTLGGSLQALKNSFNNLFEGDKATPGVKEFRQAVEDMNDTLNDPATKDGLDAIVAGMVRVANYGVKSASAVAALAKSVAEDLAAAIHGISGDDLKRQAALISAKQAMAKNVGNPKIKAEIQAEIKALQDEYRKNEAMFGPKVNIIDPRNPASMLIQPPSRTTSGSRGSSSVIDTGSKSGGRASAQRDMPDFAKEAAEELRKVVAEVTAAQEGFDAWAAQLAGPVSEAAYTFGIQQERLNELARAGEIDSAKLAVAQEQLRTEYEKNVEAINAQLTPAQEVIAGLQEELSLIGLSNIEREKEIALRYAGAEATAEQIARINELVEVTAMAREQQQYADEVQRSLTDAVVDYATGAQSAKEAFGDFADELFKRALQWVADKAIQAMFDSFNSGTAGGGSAGGAAPGGSGTGWAGFITSIIGAFGSGKAGGGTVNAGMLYPVNERGTEMLSVGGKDYLMMGSSPGRVTPNHALGGGGGFTQIIHQNYAAPNDPRTRDQMAAKVAFETQRSMTRNR